jgi:transposase
VLESMALVGLDVHQAQTRAALLDPSSGELRVERLRGEQARVVPVFLEELDRPVIAVYEAGPTGFTLARVAEQRGLDVRVVAPGSIPRAPGDRVKTDRRDATRLVRLFAAGELSYAFVPSEADEQFRDLVRCIEDARRDLMRTRHRLSKFLMRRGLRSPCKAWTQPHEKWLCKLRFEDAPSQATLVDYLAAVQMLAQRRRTLIGVLEQTVGQSSHAETVARLRCFRGIDTLTAAGVCAEVGDFRRFAKPALLSGFLGVVPSEYTSDEKRTQGQITKAGPPHARRLLVEAAHHYRHRPVVGLHLQARQVGQDPRVVEIAWRCQQRLHKRWKHLQGTRGKRTGTAAIACARELAAFCWEAATLD